MVDLSGVRTCSVCGGPIRSHNKIGICRSNPRCDRAYRKARSDRPSHRARAREYQRNLSAEERHANNLWHAHRITPDEKQAMLDAQDGKCYLCGDELAYDDAVIDHDHRCCPNVSGRVTSCKYCRRGLACGPCNTIIGMAADDPDRLRRIADALASALPAVSARIGARPRQLGLFGELPGAAPEAQHGVMGDVA